MPPNPYAWIEKSLATIHRADWYRSVQTISARPGAVIELEGCSVINFASNDYLGLAGDERLIQAAIAATQEYGTGATGSRLLSGHRELHRALELAIATLKQTEDAIVFSSGYLANLGAIATLVGKRDLILSDEYNHSSLKNGAKLSGATTLEYLHCNATDLTAKLEQHRDRHRRCLLLTDSVFSMDGDLCPLPTWIAIAQTYDCMLLIDEAHATGIFGPHGAGCAEHFGCSGQPLIQVGTLSKALGSLGGYIAGATPLIDFLRNRAPTWIYTTALTPADTAAALTAVQILQQEPQRRARLWENVRSLQSLLKDNSLLNSASNLPTPREASPIFCFPVKDATTALEMSRQLKSKGIFAPAIRPPTVTTSRLRASLMATHEPSHLQQLAEALNAIQDKPLLKD